MRMSCNGCRVLRKGCSDDCSIRPCLAWIKSPESQAHATVFLAKFYGRAGLLNLINSGPQHLRPAIFRSLLYEACGRIVNPIYGSVGLLWSGKWGLCQEALESVLKGSPITPISPDDIAAAVPPPPPPPPPSSSSSSNMISPNSFSFNFNFNIKDSAYDIRHVIKDPHHQTNNNNNNIKKKGVVHRVRTRTRFKRSSASSNTIINSKPLPAPLVPVNKPRITTNAQSQSQSPSRNSSVSHGDTTESMVSIETAAAVSRPPHSETIMLFNKDNDLIVDDDTAAAPPLLHNNNDGDDDQLIHLQLGLALFSSNPSYTSQSHLHPNNNNTNLSL